MRHVVTLTAVLFAAIGVVCVCGYSPAPSLTNALGEGPVVQKYPPQNEQVVIGDPTTKETTLPTMTPDTPTSIDKPLNNYTLRPHHKKDSSSNSGDDAAAVGDGSGILKPQGSGNAQRQIEKGQINPKEQLDTVNLLEMLTASNQIPQTRNRTYM